jgi:glycosyltransferase involved in cell wall biosynthesis
MNNRQILILISHFLPGYKMGGPTTSVFNIVNRLKDHFDFYILTSNCDYGENSIYKDVESDKWFIYKNMNIYYLSQNILNKLAIIKIINARKFDVIYLNSLFDPIYSIYILILYKIRIIKCGKIIVAPRGELYNEALEIKPFKKKLFITFLKFAGILKNIYWHASTEFEKISIAQNLNVDSEKIQVALNLTDNSNPDLYLDQLYKYKNSEIVNIVYLGRIANDKNLPYTFNILKSIKHNIVFDIFGPIEDVELWNFCLTQITSLPPNVKVNYKGSLNKTKVKETLVKYDLLFFPSFAENFGHVIAESLSVGTPVLISNNTPWRELQIKKYGWDLSLNNKNEFVDAINQICLQSNTERLHNRKTLIQNIKLNNMDNINIASNIELFN